MFVHLSIPSSIVHFLSSPLFWPSHHSQTASTQLCWFLLFAVPLLSQVLHFKLPVPWVCPDKSCIVMSSTNLVKCTHCSRVGSCLRDCMIASHPWSSGSIPPPRSSHTDSEQWSMFLIKFILMFIVHLFQQPAPSQSRPVLHQQRWVGLGCRWTLFDLSSACKSTLKYFKTTKTPNKWSEKNVS